jgi:type II secretory pathway pseudopilin PulG
MAAVLITVAVMGILLSAAMPVWRHEARREKEAELVFRGEQYARAIALFRYKNANIPNVLPPSIDALVDGKFLRKKYKDPMTEDGEFALIGMGSQQPGIQPGGGSNTPGFGGNTGGGNTGGRGNPPAQPQPNQPNMPVAGGVSGVRSKSTETSIRTYRGATRYDMWQFTFNIAPRPGGAMPMANSPDGRGGNPNMPPTFPGANPGAGRNPGQRGGPTFPPINNPGGRGPATPPPGGGRGPAGGRARGMQ